MAFVLIYEFSIGLSLKIFRLDRHLGYEPLSQNAFPSPSVEFSTLSFCESETPMCPEHSSFLPPGEWGVYKYKHYIVQGHQMHF